MKILIVAATLNEINFLIDKIGFQILHNTFYRTTFKNNQIDLVITGVGMVATAFQMGKTLTASHYDLALNFGIAGSFTEDIELGSVVNVTEDCFAELGIEDDEMFIPLHELKLLKHDSFFQEEKIVINNNPLINNPLFNSLLKVKGITVNTVHGNEKSIEKIKSMYNPVTESMEGASFLQICANEQIPCAQIRSISNYVEKRDTSKWNIPFAIQQLNEVAIQIIQELSI